MKLTQSLYHCKGYKMYHDGCNRKTAKKLFDVAIRNKVAIIDYDKSTEVPNLENYFLDIVTYIRIMTNIKGSIRELAWKIIDSIPPQFKKIYLVCDTYKEGSFKTGKRESRCCGKRYVINSPNMKILSDFSNFLKNGDNETMLLNLIN